MASGAIRKLSLLPLLVSLVTLAGAQSFRVQCPTSTITHPSNLTNVNAEPAYTGPTTLGLNGNGFYAPTGNVNGAIKCQQVSGGRHADFHVLVWAAFWTRRHRER